MSDHDESCRSRPAAACCGVDRRRFLKSSSHLAASVAALGPLGAIAGPFGPQDRTDHHVPADKKLRRAWLESLFERGGPTWYAGADLKTIGMPIGGICAGQLYLTGDGRLVRWDIFNEQYNSGYGRDNYAVGLEPTTMVRRPQGEAPAPSVAQGFALRVRAGGAEVVRPLDGTGFPGVRFCGEYPVGRVAFVDDALPVRVDLEALSPFRPLDAEDSALPATLLGYTVRNTSDAEVEVTLAGHLQNAVCLHSAARLRGEAQRTVRVVRGDGFTAVAFGARPIEPETAREVRPVRSFADFEGDDYGAWTATGEAFGPAPARGTLPDQQAVSGFRGDGLVNTFRGGDAPQGVLTSPEFTIDRRWIRFLIGGGSQTGATCINLVVAGQRVRTATGRDAERLEWHSWNVADLAGQPARIEIVDRSSAAWGHVNVDAIELADEPRFGPARGLHAQPDHGTMCLALLDDHSALATAAVGGDAQARDVLAALAGAPRATADAPIDGAQVGAVGRTFRLAPGASVRLTFAVCWHMPNLWQGAARVGRSYARRFADARAIAAHLAGNRDALLASTRLWHDTYYDSTLPRWLLDRLHAPVANLATSTCQWWRNGRFWAWEGVGCCSGTCSHVWNYAQAPARLFPRLERSVRELQDLADGAGFDPETGAVAFRGAGGRWAADGQAGTVLKAYREHRTSPDDAFLNRNWRRIRQALQFLIDQDGDGNGLLEGAQHNTYDIDYHGPNTFVGSLYLGALRAGEEMAREVGDDDFATTCRRLFETGSRLSVETLFDGDYFVQRVDHRAHPRHQYGDGCLADQMFGQSWAHQVGLGYLYPAASVRSALRSVWKYCWAPDVGPQNAVHRPERWFARPGEAGLFTCTWPKSKHLGPASTRYRNEVWTGIEYQVAGHMAWEGMVEEALVLCRAIHDRYHPARHNPWNEVECGDHYARAMASWGVLIGLCGFEYHGPAGRIGFAPRLRPERFRAAFTAAEGWGGLDQEREPNAQVDRIRLAAGRLHVATLVFELPRGARLRTASVRIGAAVVATRAEQSGERVTVSLAAARVLQPGEAIEARFAY